MTIAIQKLLNGPGIFKIDINEETRKDHLTHSRNMEKFRTRFTQEILPSVMDTGANVGQILNMDESTQGRPSMLSLLNEVSERNMLADPTKPSQVTKGQAGFSIIHTINKPGSGDKT